MNHETQTFLNALKTNRYNQYFSVKEYYKDHEPTRQELFCSSYLMSRISVLRQEIGIPFIITSGKRTMENHVEIYKKIAYMKGLQFDLSKVPTGSLHLFDFAVDIADHDGIIKKKIKKIYDKDGSIKDYNSLSPKLQWAFSDLYFEDFGHTKSWCHAQCLPPRSGSRFFKP